MDYHFKIPKYLNSSIQKGVIAMVKKCFFAVLSLLLLSFSASCSRFTPKVIETPHFKKWTSSVDAPKTVAVLPFANETELEDLDQLVRESFYKHFSVRNFFDIEIEDIDEIIRMLEEAEGKDFHNISPKKLGEFLRCDALVYGRVTRLKKIFLLIYSQMHIEAEIRIVEAQSGKELWRHTFSKRFHEGGVPGSPFGVIPAAIRTSYSLRESKRNRDIDAFCKDFVSCIPEIRHIQAARINEICEVQLASFKVKEGALTISSTLCQHGYKPFLRKVSNDDEIWYRVMVGPFVSREEALRYKVKLEKEFNFLNPIVVKSEKSNGLSIKQDSIN